MHKSWHKFVDPTSQGFNKVDKFLQDNAGTYYPLYPNVFKAFEVPVKDVRVVIIGQDPYPGEDHNNVPYATGLAFANPREADPLAYSLRQIESELAISVANDIALGHEPLPFGPYFDPSLTNWAAQGVLLINAALTVEKGNVGSHRAMWGGFTKRILTQLSKEKNGIVFCLWGKEAQAYQDLIQGEQIILKANHPAASKYNPNLKFLGCGHFNKINDLGININWLN
jgi:uracil-DNA glycosylase